MYTWTLSGEVWCNHLENRILRDTGGSLNFFLCFHMHSPVANIIDWTGWIGSSGVLLIQFLPQILSLTNLGPEVIRLGLGKVHHR